MTNLETSERPEADERTAVPTVRAWPDVRSVAAAARSARVPPLVAHVLVARGVVATEGAPAGTALHEGIDEAVLSRAAELVDGFLRAGEDIVLHAQTERTRAHAGADAVCAAALAALGLRALGGRVTPTAGTDPPDGWCVRIDADRLVVRAGGRHADVTAPNGPAAAAHALMAALHARVALERNVGTAEFALLGAACRATGRGGTPDAAAHALLEGAGDALARPEWPALSVAIGRIDDRASVWPAAVRAARRLAGAVAAGEADSALQSLLTASERRARELRVFMDALTLDDAATTPPERPEAADALVLGVDLEIPLVECLRQHGLAEARGAAGATFAVAGPLRDVTPLGAAMRHVSVHVDGVRGVAWNEGARLDAWRALSSRDVLALGTLRRNAWRNEVRAELNVTRLQPLERIRFDDPHGAPSDRGALERRPGGIRPDGLAAPTDDEAALERQIDTFLGRSLEAGALHLTALDLQSLRDTALSFPSTGELRAAFVRLMRGERLDHHACGRRCREVLEELELLDARGRARKGERRDPYTNERFMRGLLLRHRLLSLEKAYRFLDDASFGMAVRSLRLP